MDMLLESLIKVTDNSSQPTSRHNNPVLPFPASWGPEGGQVPWNQRTLSFSSL